VVARRGPVIQSIEVCLSLWLLLEIEKSRQSLLIQKSATQVSKDANQAKELQVIDDVRPSQLSGMNFLEKCGGSSVAIRCPLLTVKTPNESK
jgi:hypothetical protein